MISATDILELIEKDFENLILIKNIFIIFYIPL